tara:strand:- start:66 stop:188 length:123 start_codon:yes stop_codon:yes gene_type:complete
MKSLSEGVSFLLAYIQFQRSELKLEREVPKIKFNNVKLNQ